MASRVTVEVNKPTTSITIAPRPSQAAAPKVVDEREGLWGDDGFTFGDFIDMINPFQHIPIVSTIYRELTGDTISKGARMVGGTLLGGAIGFATAAANSIIESATGNDIGGNVVTALKGDAPPGQASPTQLASLEPSAASDAIVEEQQVTPVSNYDNPPPSPYNKKASKLYRMRQGITEAQQIAMRYEQKLKLQA